jgi:hypothetical protein
VDQLDLRPWGRSLTQEIIAQTPADSGRLTLSRNVMILSRRMRHMLS